MAFFIDHVGNRVFIAQCNSDTHTKERDTWGIFLSHGNNTCNNLACLLFLDFNHALGTVFWSRPMYSYLYDITLQIEK